jgi:EAL domain-containing protein (putative c-di-GMP-specific phosphodiesterase class I)
MTASIGIATLTENSKSGEQVLKNAVVACDLAKEQGGDRAHSYGGDDANMRQREASMWMVGTVHNALREDLFLLYAQPIEPLKPTSKLHLEILLRMQTGDEILAPNAFLPASERYQLMSAIDRWVFAKTLAEVRRYLDSGPLVEPIFSINLSGQSFSNPDFLDFLQSTLLESGVPGGFICFEVTETAAISDVRSAKKLIAAMQQHDCKFSLDDFGTGLSSFAYLKSFDVDYLKIDGALVKDIADDRVSAAMVESINQIAHVMGIETIAEFVESSQVKNTLARIGVDYVQGYMLGTPTPLRQQLEYVNSQVRTSTFDLDTVPLP